MTDLTHFIAEVWRKKKHRRGGGGGRVRAFAHTDSATKTRFSPPPPLNR